MQDSACSGTDYNYYFVQFLLKFYGFVISVARPVDWPNVMNLVHQELYVGVWTVVRVIM